MPSHSPISACGPGLRIGAIFIPIGSRRIPHRVENEAAGKGGATGKMEGIRQPNTPAPAGERKEQHGTGYGRRYRRADFPTSWTRSRVWSARVSSRTTREMRSNGPGSGSSKTAWTRPKHRPKRRPQPPARRSACRSAAHRTRPCSHRCAVRTACTPCRSRPAGQRFPSVRRGGPRPNAVQHFPVRTGGGTPA